jgi:VanZ family protein
VAARWALVLAWMAVVFFASSISDLGRAKRVPDWISHPVEYGAGAVLVCRALEGGRRRPLTLSTALTATLLTTAYGVTDEYHQSFVPGRTADPADVAKDLGGAALACALYRRWTSS